MPISLGLGFGVTMGGGSPGPVELVSDPSLADAEAQAASYSYTVSPKPDAGAVNAATLPGVQRIGGALPANDGKITSQNGLFYTAAAYGGSTSAIGIETATGDATMTVTWLGTSVVTRFAIKVASADLSQPKAAIWGVWGTNGDVSLYQADAGNVFNYAQVSGTLPQKADFNTAKGSALAAGDTMQVSVAGDTVQFIFGGQTIRTITIASGYTGKGYGLMAISDGAAAGPIMVQDDGAEPFSASAPWENDPTSEGYSVSVILSGVDQPEFAIVRAGGSLVLNWTPATFDGDTATVMTPVLAPEPGYNLLIRDALDHSRYVLRRFDGKLYAPIRAAQIGMNEAYMGPYYNTDQHRNLYDGAELRTASSAFITSTASRFVDSDDLRLGPDKLGADGTILPAGGDITAAGLAGIYIQVGGANKTADRKKPHTITPPPGLTIAANLLVGCTATGGGSAGSPLTITITADSYFFIVILQSGTIPVGGWRPTIKPNGDTSTLLPSDTVIADHVAITTDGGPIRAMTPRNTNLSYQTGISQPLRLPAGSSALSVAWQVDLCNAAMRDMWYNAHDQATDQVIADDLAYIHANLDPGLRCYLEMSNEVVWNQAFPQHDRFRLLGLQRGLIGKPSVTPLFQTVRADGYPLQKYVEYSDTLGSYPNIAVPAGSYVYGVRAGTGYLVWRALQDVPAGTAYAFPASGSNAYWEVFADNGETTAAGLRAYADKSVALFDAAYAAAPASRWVRVIANQSRNLNNAIATLSWNDAGLKCDYYATAPYWDRGYGSAELPGWGSADRTAMGSSDLATREAAKTKLFADFPTAIAEAVNGQATLIHGIERWRVGTMGWAPGAMRYGTYESGQHIDWQKDKPARLYQTAAEIWADSRFGDAQRDYIEAYAKQCGDVLLLFDLTSPNDGASRYRWGFQSAQGERGGFAQFAGVLAAKGELVA